MKYVYVLQSDPFPNQTYVGITGNLQARLEAHNGGRSPYTAAYRPWRLVVAIKFVNDGRATAFERYLKSGSGRAFSRRHFW